jgi:2-dehydropantoate 2-reductase
LADYHPEVIFITVKANALPADRIGHRGLLHRPGMYVVSWQNGIDTELEMAATLGRNRQLLRAVVNYGCGLKAPGRMCNMPFHHPPHYIQELHPDSQPAAIGRSPMPLLDSGLTTERTDQIVSMVWRKGVLNACMNPVCAVTGLTMAQA